MTTDPQLDPTLAEMYAYIDRKIVEGFETPEAISQSAFEEFYLEDDEYSAETLQNLSIRYTEQALEKQKAIQSTWPVETDCDRLDAVFMELEASGIVARQHFHCCGTCASGLIVDEIDKALSCHIPVRGFAYYHSHETEAAIDQGELYLNYGGLDDTEIAAITIGHEIVDVLKKHSFAPVWNASCQTGILVPINWQRRIKPMKFLL